MTTTPLHLDRTAACTVLAALSLYGENDFHSDAIRDIATDCGNLTDALDSEGVGHLYSRISDISAAAGRDVAAPEVDAAEFCTVMAALQSYDDRGMGEPFNRSDEIHAIASDDGEVAASLDHEGIQGLIEEMQVWGLGLSESPSP